jgi:outer membrane protein TolC
MKHLVQNKAPVRRRSSFVRTFSLCFLIAATEVSASPLRYDELPDLVKKGNGAVESAEHSVEASRLRTGHLVRSLLPHVDILGGAEHFRTGPYPNDTQPYGGLELFVNVYRGGQDSLEERHRQAQLSAAEAEKDKSVRGQLSQARSLYWDLVFERELATLLKEMNRRNSEGAKAASRRKSRGLVSDTDVLAFDLNSLQLKEKIESSEHEIELVQMALRPRLNWKEDEKIETPTIIPHDHDEGILSAKADGTSHPATRSLFALAESADAQASQQGRWWLPSIDVYGTYQLYTLRERFYPNLQDRFDWSVGFRLRMHLFEGAQQIREAESGHRSAQAYQTLADYTKRTTDAEIRLTQEEMRHIHELVHGAEETMEKGKRILNQSLAEYDRGVRTTSDMLGMNDRVLSYQRTYLERRRDYQKAKVKLLSLLGQ